MPLAGIAGAGKQGTPSRPTHQQHEKHWGMGGTHYPVQGTSSLRQATWMHCGNKAQGVMVSAAQAAPTSYFLGEQPGTHYWVLNY